MIGVLWSLALTLGPARLGLPSIPEAPAAAVIDVAGEVGDDLTLGRGLTPGAPLALGPGASVTLWVYPATLWSVDGPGRFVVDTGRVFAIESARVPRSVDVEPLAASPVIAQTTALGAHAKPLVASAGPLHPAGEAVSAHERILRWSAPPGEDTTLTLALLTPSGPPRVLERWTGLRGGQLRTWAPLRAGRWYRWEVASAGSVGGAWFYVWTVEEEGALRAALEAALPDVGPHPKTAAAAVRALALERAGAWSEAEARWRELLAIRPDAPGVARHLQALHTRVVRPPRRGLPALIARALRR